MTTTNQTNFLNPTKNNDTIQITHAIQEVCHARQITCLHAIESGSRAWGFASPDSDYDVRLLYCHDTDWYLSLFEGKDTFEFIEEGLLAVPFDIGGWDIRKALRLIYKSNAVIFEWLHSPIIYQQHLETMVTLKTLSLDYFQPIAAFHHYLGMAKTASANLDLTAPIKLKKLFYLLRSLLAANWILTFASPPPVIMIEMFELVSNDIRIEILQLIDVKSNHDESYVQSLSPLMQRAINMLWSRLENPKFDSQLKQDVTPLNEFYRQVLHSH